MRFHDMFGRRLDMSYRGVLALFSHRVTIGFLVMVAVAFFALDPHRFRSTMPVPLALLTWVLAVGLVVVLKLVNFAWVSVVTSRRQVPVYLPILSAMEFYVTIVVGEQIAVFFSRGVWVPNILPNYFYYLITLLVVETFFVRYLAPDILRETGFGPGDRTPPAAAPPFVPEEGAVPSLSLGARRFRLTKVQYAVSEEHYVRLVLTNEEIMHRAKLTDLVAQTRPEDGFQPHRSWWISRHAQPRLSKDGGRFWVQIGDEVEAPVARARTKQVQDWFDEYSDW